MIYDMYASMWAELDGQTDRQFGVSVDLQGGVVLHRCLCKPSVLAVLGLRSECYGWRNERRVLSSQTGMRHGSVAATMLACKRGREAREGSWICGKIG